MKDKSKEVNADKFIGTPADIIFLEKKDPAEFLLGNEERVKQ